ncbi:MAG: hypothetical protein IIZ73_09960, partial [Ruminococcus sp.]|nr:hypothetical protein [Ruminococcus sp.]
VCGGRDCFGIHPLRRARCIRVSLSAESDEGAAVKPQAYVVDPQAFSRKKSLAKILFVFWWGILDFGWFT